MTAFAAPYTLLRRDGEALASRAAPPHAALDLPPGPSALAERRHGLSRAEVERIIGDRAFGVAFQPVVRLADQRPVSHEALLRLRPAAGPGIATRGFVDAAQAWGLGAALDLAVLDLVLGAWPRAAATPVSVNLGAGTLADPAFCARLLDRAGDAAGRVAVEVSAAADVSAVLAAVPVLREGGVRVVLDDAAADEASLAALRAARFDAVKFSGALVAEAMGDGRARRLLRALVQLAAAGGAVSVAKLVETVPQAQAMRAAGVDCGQGWLFGAPVLHDPGRRRAAH